MSTHMHTHAIWLHTPAQKRQLISATPAAVHAAVLVRLLKRRTVQTRALLVQTFAHVPLV
jgi:hypothetical protein